MGSRLRPPLLPLLPLASLVPLLALLGCTGTADGGKGDPLHAPNANKLGDGDHLTDILGPATWLKENNPDSANCAAPPERTIYVTGVTVMAVDRYDETADGQRGNLYVQDTVLDPAEYSGVTVFSPSFSPPDLRLAEGDVADINGALQEFIGPSSFKFGDCKTLPELSGTMSFRLENGTRTPKAISLDELKSYDKARRWLGMLVKLTPMEGATAIAVAQTPEDAPGRYQVSLDVGAGVKQSDVPKITNELYDLRTEGPPLAAGTQFKSITGIVTYFFGFHIAPRSKDDFEQP